MRLIGLRRRIARAILEVLAPCENGNCPNPGGEGKLLVPPGIRNLSELTIDVHKDWAGYRIENLGAPTAVGHALRKGDASLAIWNDTPGIALNETGRTVTLTWTDLDLTEHTSADAKFAMLLLSLSPTVIGTGDQSYVAVRKNGTFPPIYPMTRFMRTWVEMEFRTGWVVGLDAGQLIEYTIMVDTGWTVDTIIAVLGYIE